MKRFSACSALGHNWHPLPGAQGGRSQQCSRCGYRQQVELIYLGPGSGIGRLVHAPRPDALLDVGASVAQGYRD